MYRSVATQQGRIGGLFFQELIKTVAFLGFHSFLLTSGLGKVVVEGVGGGGADWEELALESVIEH